MNSSFGKIKHFLSYKIVTLAILAIAISSRIIQLTYFFNLKADRSHQTIATQNLLYGHGISSVQVLPNNLSEIIYQPLIKWPPGYSYLLSPFYALFNHNYIAAGLTLDLFFAIIFIFITRRILKTFGSPLYLINIYTLVTSFIIYSFYQKPSSDAIAITLFLIAIYFTLQLLKTDHSWKLKTFGIIICLFICALTKYLYVPVVFIIPAFLIIKGWADSRKQLKKAGILSFLILAAALTTLLLYQKSISGTVGYIAQPTRGFFPENLSSIYPLIPASFVNPDTVLQLTGQQPDLHTVGYKIFQLLHILLAIGIISYVFLIMFKRGIKNISLSGDFLYLLFFISLSITILLIVLSLKVAKENNVWTYIQEPRYFGLSVVLLQLAAFVTWQNHHKKQSKILKYVFYTFVLLLLTEMIHGVYFNAKRLINYKKEVYGWQHDYRFQQFAQKIIQKEQQKKPIENIVLACSSPYMNNRISLYSHIPVLKEIDKINNLSSLNTKTSVLLLVVLREDALKDFVPFLSLKEKEDAGHFARFYFYTVYVEPH